MNASDSDYLRGWLAQNYPGFRWEKLTPLYTIILGTDNDLAIYISRSYPAYRISVFDRGGDLLERRAKAPLSALKAAVERGRTLLTRRGNEG